MKENKVNNEIIPFKRYFDEMEREQKVEFFAKMGIYASSSHIYTCLRTNKFSSRIKLSIETITGKKFIWDETV